jgi:UPF0271 protein
MKTIRFIDINCDIGEGQGAEPSAIDRELMTLVSSVNIACGYHAGNLELMAAIVRLAAQNRVAIGAHPGYPDRENFGRRELSLPITEIEEIVLAQIKTLAEIADRQKAKLIHVKPHGALYNQASRDATIARAIARAVRHFSSGLILVGLAGSQLIEAGLETGLPTASEGFPERAYESDGSLRSRNLPGALISDAGKAAEQGLHLAMDGITFNKNGNLKKYPVDTLCIHGDSPGVLGITRALRKKLEEAGYSIAGLNKSK